MSLSSYPPGVSGNESQIERRFLSKVSLGNGCWEWLGSRNTQGYGFFWRDGKNRPAHREAWLLFRGAIAAGLWVLHRCDNPPCVRPDHLWLGTPSDNTIDGVRKGRIIVPDPSHVGEANGRSLLKADVIPDIRDRKNSRRELSEKYGVSISTIKAVRERRIWRHV